MNDRITQESGAIRICVDWVDGLRAGGRVFSQRLAAPLPFSDLGSLLLRLEGLLEEQNFPQAFHRLRSFSEHVRQVRGTGLLPERAMPAEEVARAAGKQATLILHIYARQKATWQGVVDWLDQKNPPSHFTSALAFLHVMEAGLLRTCPAQHSETVPGIDCTRPMEPREEARPMSARQVQNEEPHKASTEDVDDLIFRGEPQQTSSQR